MYFDDDSNTNSEDNSEFNVKSGTFDDFEKVDGNTQESHF